MLIDKLLKNPLPLALAASLVVVVVYLLGRKTVKDAAAAIENLNAGTPYAGGGIVGTLGNATNRLSGGNLQAVGESISSWLSPSTVVDNVTYAVLWPNGVRHGINSHDIDRGGYFNGPLSVYPWHDGKRWRIGVNIGNQRVAVPAEKAA